MRGSRSAFFRLGGWPGAGWPLVFRRTACLALIALAMASMTFPDRLLAQGADQASRADGVRALANHHPLWAVGATTWAR